jgi:hypothetical protein
MITPARSFCEATSKEPPPDTQMNIAADQLVGPSHQVGNLLRKRTKESDGRDLIRCLHKTPQESRNEKTKDTPHDDPKRSEIQKREEEQFEKRRNWGRRQSTSQTTFVSKKVKIGKQKN